MKCDRCTENYPFAKPLNTCTTVNGWSHDITTYVLCNECLDKLKKFLENNRSGSGTDE